METPGPLGKRRRQTKDVAAHENASALGTVSTEESETSGVKTDASAIDTVAQARQRRENQQEIVRQPAASLEASLEALEASEIHGAVADYDDQFIEGNQDSRNPRATTSSQIRESIRGTAVEPNGIDGKGRSQGRADCQMSLRETAVTYEDFIDRSKALQAQWNAFRFQACQASIVDGIPDAEKVSGIETDYQRALPTVAHNTVGGVNPLLGHVLQDITETTNSESVQKERTLVNAGETIIALQLSLSDTRSSNDILKFELQSMKGQLEHFMGQLKRYNCRQDSEMLKISGNLEVKLEQLFQSLRPQLEVQGLKNEQEIQVESSNRELACDVQSLRRELDVQLESLRREREVQDETLRREVEVQIQSLRGQFEVQSLKKYGVSTLARFGNSEKMRENLYQSDDDLAPNSKIVQELKETLSSWKEVRDMQNLHIHSKAEIIQSRLAQISDSVAVVQTNQEEYKLQIQSINEWLKDDQQREPCLRDSQTLQHTQMDIFSLAQALVDAKEELHLYKQKEADMNQKIVLEQSKSESLRAALLESRQAVETLHQQLLESRQEVETLHQKVDELNVSKNDLELKYGKGKNQPGQELQVSGPYSFVPAPPYILETTYSDTIADISTFATSFASYIARKDINNSAKQKLMSQHFCGIHFVRSADDIFALEAFICYNMFWGFENETFVPGEPSLFGPAQLRATSLELFHQINNPETTLHQLSILEERFQFYCVGVLEVLLRSVCNTSDVVRVTNYLLAEFEVDKAAPKTPKSRKKRSGAEDREETTLCKVFSRAARKVWGLHKLCHSFEPPARILRVERGIDVDSNYMVNVGYEHPSPSNDCAEAQPRDTKVAFMVLPGIRSGNHIMKCKIYIAQPDHNES